VQNISCDGKEYADSDNNSWILSFSQTLGFRYQHVAPACQTVGRLLYLHREHLSQFSRGLNSLKSIKITVTE